MLKKSQIIDLEGFLENNYTLDIIDSDIPLEGMIVLKESLGEDNTFRDNIHLRGTAEAWLDDFDIVVVGSSGMVLISRDVNQMYLDYPEAILEEVKKLIRSLKDTELYSRDYSEDMEPLPDYTDRWWWYSTKSPIKGENWDWVYGSTVNTAISTNTADNILSNVTNILPGNGVHSS